VRWTTTGLKLFNDQCTVVYRTIYCDIHFGNDSMGTVTQAEVSHIRLWHHRLTQTGYENEARATEHTKGMGDINQTQHEPCEQANWQRAFE
jgi:hypothetical protein